MKKNNSMSYMVKLLNGMAFGLFSSLIIGLIIKQVGVLTNYELLKRAGTTAQLLMGPAIGVGIASAINASPLVLMSSAIAGAIGAGTVTFQNGVGIFKIGEPLGAMIASWIACSIANKLTGKTKLDIILLPFSVISLGALTGFFVSPYVSSFMKYLGYFINMATELHPIPMGILVSVSMGMILTLPISSAAIAISLGLSGLAAGSAVVGCCCNMIGFAVISYKDNNFGGFFAQAIGTSMLQIPNIVKKPIIWLPAILSSAILGPISSFGLKMINTPEGAGMGTSGLVGQIAYFSATGFNSYNFVIILIMHFILPAALSFIFYYILKKVGLIKNGDMKLQ